MGLVSGTALKNKIRIDNVMIREGLAEFLGTFLLVAFGCASVAQHVVPPHLNSFLGINLGFGFGATMAVWACGGVSGGHINPAVTLAMAILGRTKFVKVPVYWIGQYLGAFVAAACVFGIYYDGINMFDGGVRAVTGPNATAGIFGTYPQDYVSISSALGDQIFSTMLLVLCVMAITDPRNMGVPQGLAPIAVGCVIMLIGLCFGQNCGFPINPARDLAPRLLTAIAGYGSACFTSFNYYFWIPIVGPHIGAVCGAWIYLILVGVHIPEEANKYEVDDDTKNPKVASELREVSDSRYNRPANDPSRF